MPKYRVMKKETAYFDAIIEAVSPDEARDKADGGGVVVWVRDEFDGYAEIPLDMIEEVTDAEV